MRNLSNTVFKIIVGCAFLILLFSFSCENERTMSYDEVLFTDIDGVYMVAYKGNGDNKNRRTLFALDNQHARGLLLGCYDDFPSKEVLMAQLERKKYTFQLTYDSIGVYSKANDEVLAMFYSKMMEGKGKVSSTNYSNPLVGENWVVKFDDSAYAVGELNICIGTVTFTLKKL